MYKLRIQQLRSMIRNFCITHICVALLLLHFPLQSSGQPINCPVSVNIKVHQCMAPVKRYAEVLTNSSRNARESNRRVQASHNGGVPDFNTFSNLGKEVFTELCKVVRIFDRCVSEARARMDCPNHVTLKLMDASYGYLCGAGYTVFYQNADCLMELDQKKEAKDCHDETLANINNINRNTQMPFSTKMDRMCHALNSFASCVRKPIATECGLESWHVIFRVLKDTTHTVLPKCPFETSVDLPVDYSLHSATDYNELGVDRRPIVPVNRVGGEFEYTRENFPDPTKEQRMSGNSNRVTVGLWMSVMCLAARRLTSYVM